MNFINLKLKSVDVNQACNNNFLERRACEIINVLTVLCVISSFIVYTCSHKFIVLRDFCERRIVSVSLQFKYQIGLSQFLMKYNLVYCKKWLPYELMLSGSHFEMGNYTLFCVKKIFSRSYFSSYASEVTNNVWV